MPTMDTSHGHKRTPSRQRISALSPLQAFSPLQQPEVAPTASLGMTRTSRSSSISSTYSVGVGTPGAGSGAAAPGALRRSLSGRERVFRRDTSTADLTGLDGEYPTGITTRLILVKAPHDKPAAGTDNQLRSLRQRSKSSSNLELGAVSAAAASATADVPATSLRKPRRSFAAASFASFAPMSPINTNEEEQPQAPPPRRPSFTQLSFAAEGTSGGAAPAQATTTLSEPRKTLSPEQVLELARGLMAPVAAPEPGEPALHRANSTGSALTRRKSTGGAVALRSITETPTTQEPIELEPVDYVEMDEDTLLPFSDRPTQVDELLHHPVNADMLAQLKQAFPQGPARNNWRDIDVTQWNWEEMLLHLTRVSRIECPDYPWVLLARTAVRAHAVSMWEILGACLGCDSDLISAGDEDDTAPGTPVWSGYGVGGGEDAEDAALARVHIEALKAVEPEELEAQERALALEFGPPVEGDLWQATGMETIGEKDESSSRGSGSGSSGSRSTSAPREAPDARREISPRSTPRLPLSSRVDPSPFTSPLAATRSLSQSPSGLGRIVSNTSSDDSSISPFSPRSQRARSFVGLQIMTSTPDAGAYSPRGSEVGLGLGSPRADARLHGAPLTQFERTPGNPLFVSSFNTLSLAPNLVGRKSFAPGTGGGLGGYGPSSEQVAQFNSSFRRRSGTGLSESAITFVSDSSVSAA